MFFSSFFEEKLDFYQKINNHSYSDLTFVGNELWAFAPSSEDNKEFNYIYRYKVDFDKKEFVLLGKIKHNFGHCNSVDYNPDNDCLIFGSGSTYEKEMYTKIYFVENISKLNKNELDINRDAIIIDLSLEDRFFGSKINVCWENENRFFISSSYENTCFIRLCKLTDYSENNYKLEYIYSNKTSYSYDVCTQGLEYRNGYLFEGYGHNSFQLFVREINENFIKTVNFSYKINIDCFEKDIENETIQGVSIIDNHLIICLVKNYYLTYFLSYDLTDLEKSL